MNAQKVKEFVNSLKHAKYGIGRDEGYIIYDEALPHLEARLLNFVNENNDAEIGTLQAKIKFYEEVISKSNFASMIGNDLIEKIKDDFSDIVQNKLSELVTKELGDIAKPLIEYIERKQLIDESNNPSS